MEKKAIAIIFFLSTALFLSGCSKNENNRLMQIKESREFLKENPDAEVNTSLFEKSDFETLKAFAPKECAGLEEKAYYKVTLSSNGKKMTLYLDKETLEKECVSGQKALPAPEKTPAPGPTETTTPVPTQTPEPTPEEKTCEELKGTACSASEYCYSEFLDASDSSRCCPGPCSDVDPCENTECPGHLKCKFGECILKTCAERNGTICTETQKCSESYLNVSDSEKCCSGECIGTGGAGETQIDVNAEFGPFIEKVENGENAEMFFETAVTANAGTQTSQTITTSSLLENEALEEGNYRFSQTIEGMEIEFSEAYRQYLMESGYSEEEVEQQEQMANTQLQGSVGIEQICVYENPADMAALLKEWEAGNYSKNLNNAGFCQNANPTPAPTATPTLAPGEAQGDLWAAGEIKPARITFGSSETEKADCFMGQKLYFELNNSSDENIESLMFDAYVDGEKASLDDLALSRLIGEEESGFASRIIVPGKQTAYFGYDKSIAGHTVRVVIDPGNYVSETNEENNEIVTEFEDEKMDLAYVSSEYRDFFGDIELTIQRDKELDSCPHFNNAVFVDGVEKEKPSFFGFNEGELETELWGPRLGPGTYEIRLIIDVNNQVEETDETNNDVTFTFEIPE